MADRCDHGVNASLSYCCDCLTERNDYLTLWVDELREERAVLRMRILDLESHLDFARNELLKSDEDRTI
jgi:hypothetical protein